MTTPKEVPEGVVMPVGVTKIEILTPKQAENLLKKNKVNRKLRQMKVDQYRRDMTTGKWDPNASRLMRDENGNLIDGQHRLTAQVEAGLTLAWVITSKVPPETQENLDTHGSRSLGDILDFRGEVNTALLAATGRLITAIEQHGLAMGRWQSSNEEVIATIERHPNIRLSVEIANKYRLRQYLPLAPSLQGAAHWLIMEANDRELADNFIDRINSGAGEVEGSPILALIRRVNEIKRLNQRVQGRDYINLLIKTWNYDVEGRSIGKLTLYSRRDEFKLLEPLVHPRAGEDEQGEGE